MLNTNHHLAQIQATRRAGIDSESNSSHGFEMAVDNDTEEDFISVE
jgi:hypothetical protein